MHNNDIFTTFTLFHMVPLLTQLLITDTEFKSQALQFKSFFRKVKRMTFWQKHFANQGFKLNSGILSQKYWQQIPTLSLNDIKKIGLNPRLKDAAHFIKRNTYEFILRPYSNENVLFLENISNNKGRNIGARLQFTKSYNSALQQILMSLPFPNDFQVIIDPQKLDSNMIGVINEIEFNTIAANPIDLAKLANLFPNENKLKNIKTLIFVRPKMYLKQIQLLKRFYSKAKFISIFPLAGASRAVRSCLKAQESFGENLVHPRRFSFIEIAPGNESDYGELIITTTKPAELSLIRFRTGVFGKAFYKKCKCGEYWNILLEREKKYNLSSLSSALF